MITLTALAIGAGSFLIEKLSDYYIEKKLDKIFENKEDFESQLRSVINKSLDEYELRYKTQDSNGQYAFYKSQNVINELLRYRIISDEYDFNDLIKVIDSDQCILKPSKKQLEYFFEVFETNILKNKKLRKLEIKENFQSEIYKISDKLDELKSIVKNAISEINTALKDEWKIQLSDYQTLIEDFKPTTAIKLLGKIEERFNIAEIKPSDKIYSKLYYLKALCFDLLKDSNNARQEYIKAYKKDNANNDYKKKAIYSYFLLDQVTIAKQLANELLIEQEYDPICNFIKTWNANSDEFINLISKLPAYIKDDFIFKRLCYSHLYLNETLTENSEINNYLESVRNSFSDKEIKSISYSNFFEVLFRIEFAFNVYIRRGYIDFSEKPESNLSEMIFINNTTNLALDVIKASEIKDLYPHISFLKHYSDYLINAKPESLSEMKKSFVDAKISDPNYCLILAGCLMSVNQYDSSIELIDKFETKHEELLSLKALCYAKKGDDQYFKEFEEYLHVVSIIGIQQFYRIMDYLINSFQAKRISSVDLLSILDKTFESENYKKVLQLALNLLQQENKTGSIDLFNFLDERKEMVEQKTFSYCAFCYLLKEEHELARATYNLYLDKEIESQDLWYYIHVLYESKRYNEELLMLLKKWRVNFNVLLKFLVIEINLRNYLSEWNEVVDIANKILEHKPYDEDFYTIHIHALNQLGKLDEISNLVPILFTIPVKKEINALNIFNVLFLNSYYSEAFEFIYPFALDRQNTSIRTQYITGTINFSEYDKFFIQYDTATEGLFVKYELAGKSEIVEIGNGSKNLFANELIGAKTGDIVKIKRPMTDVFDDVKVIRIMNKYLALFEDILNQAENPHSGLPLQQFKFDDMSPEALNEFFIKNFGSSGSERKEYLDESFQQYISNLMSFSIFTIKCADNNYFKSYYFLANKEKGFLTCPIGLQNPQIDFSKKYVIDFTSLIALYEIDQKLEMIFEAKFIIPKTLFDRIEVEYKNEKIQPRSKMSIDITSEGVRPIFFPENYKENQLKFYEALIKWIYEHCEVVVVESKLDYLRNNPDKNEKLSDEMAIILDILYLLQQPDNLLICDDQLFYNPILPNICSTEMFLKSKGENIQAINSFFLMKGYIGLTLNEETLLTEFCKKRDGNEDSYIECLKNIEFTIQYSPVYIIKQVVSFLKEIYADNIFCTDINTDTKEVFKYIIKGIKDIKAFYYLQSVIQTEFQSISAKTEQVLQNLNETVEQEYGDTSETGM